MNKILILSLLIEFVTGVPVEKNYGDADSGSCALRACNSLDPNKINVHLIPHSHDDVGWLKTVDDYYFGLRDDVQNVGVQYILDSALQALKKDSRRRLLNDTLGDCGRPRIGWKIDPFGHSREQASIFKQMGYEAIFFTRLSEDDRRARKSTQDLEFYWKSNDNFGKQLTLYLLGVNKFPIPEL